MIDEHTRLAACLEEMAAIYDATIKSMAIAGYSDVEIGRRVGRDRQWVRRRRVAIGQQAGYRPCHGTAWARLRVKLRTAIAA